MCLGDMKRKAQQGIAINERILEKKRLALWDAVQSKHNPKLPSLSNLLQTKRFKDLSAEYTVNSCAEAILKAIMPSAPLDLQESAARSGELPAGLAAACGALLPLRYTNNDVLAGG